MDIDFTPEASIGSTRPSPAGESPFNSRQLHIIDNVLPFLLQEVPATHEQRRMILLLLYHINMSKDQLDKWLKKHPDTKRKAGQRSAKGGHCSWPFYIDAELPSASAVVHELPLTPYRTQISVLLHIDNYVKKHLDVSNQDQRERNPIQWTLEPIQWENRDLANVTAKWKSLTSRCYSIRDIIPRKNQFFSEGLRRTLLTKSKRKVRRNWTEEEKLKLRKGHPSCQHAKYEELHNLINALLSLEVFPSVETPVTQPYPHFLGSIWSMCRAIQMIDDHMLQGTEHKQSRYRFVRVFIGVVQRALFCSIQASSRGISAATKNERGIAERQVLEKKALLEIFTRLASVEEEELVTTICLASCCTAQALSSRINHEDPFIIDIWNEHSRSWKEQSYLPRHVPLDPLMSYPEMAPTECTMFIMCTRLSTLLLDDPYHQDAFPLASSLWDVATGFQYHDSGGNGGGARVSWNVKTWAMTEAATALGRLSSLVRPPAKLSRRQYQLAVLASALFEGSLPFRRRISTHYVQRKGAFHFDLDETESTISKIIYTARYMQEGSSPVCQIVAANLMRKAAGLLKLLPKVAKHSGLKEEVRINEDGTIFRRSAAEICREVGRYGHSESRTTWRGDEAG